MTVRIESWPFCILPGPRAQPPQPRGAAPPGVRTLHIYRGIIPFVGLNLLVIAGHLLLPGLATWLPAQLFGR